MVTPGKSTKGQPVEARGDELRIDAREKVTGQTKYIEDLPDLPGTVYGAAIRSPYSHARILSIDSSKAERLPGVVGVLDRECLEGLNPHVKGGDQSFITIDKARFDGDLLGMVAAVDQRTAHRALELIDVEYEPLPPVFSAKEALTPGASILHEELGSNLALEAEFAWGDVERALKQADHIIEETFLSQNVFHHPMEPSTSFIANFLNDTAELWAPTNNPFSAAPDISSVFGINAEDVRVRVPYVGGGFGAKPITPEMISALALSRKIRRPVKFIASAEESFRVNARHAMVYKAKVGVKSDGTLLALDVELEIDTGAYFTGARTVTRSACNSAWGCYRFPHFRVRAHTVYTNKVPAAHFRSTGKTQTSFGIECTIDSVARKIGIDPYGLRRKNILLRGERVTDKWKWGGEECIADTPPMDTDYEELMRRALEPIHWDGRTQSRTSESSANSRLVRGRGLAITLRRGSHVGGRAYAMATVNRDGIVKITHNAPDLGQGVNTVMNLIASKTLGIPQSQVQVGTPDTINDLRFDGTNSMRVTVQMGNAVLATCENLKQELKAAAVQVRGGNPGDWQVVEGNLCLGEWSFSFGDIVRAFPATGSSAGAVIKAMGSYGRAASADKAIGGLEYWAPGAAAVEVEVDRETGEIRVLQYSLVADAGKALHHISAARNIEGGAIMGLGISLFEELLYQDGQLQNADAFQYRLPLLGDIPERFHSSLVENGDGPGPFGAKGIAQTSITCAAPAIGNAIFDAIGVNVRSTPFTPEKILRALGKLSIGKQGPVHKR